MGEQRHLDLLTASSRSGLIDSRSRASPITTSTVLETRIVDHQQSNGVSKEFNQRASTRGEQAFRLLFGMLLDGHHDVGVGHLTSPNRVDVTIDIAGIVLSTSSRNRSAHRDSPNDSAAAVSSTLQRC